MSGSYGGFAPYPRQYGGGKTRAEYIYDALNSTRGALYDTSDDSSPVCVENRAFALAIDNEWAANERALNQFFAPTTTDMLPRWERIFFIPAAPDTSDGDRRTFLGFKFAALTKYPTNQQMVDDLKVLAPGSFVDLTHTSSATGPVYYPGSPFANPYTMDGNTVAGVSIVDWWSNVLHVGVQITQPVGMPSWLHQKHVAAILTYLDGALPAWVTFATYTLDVHGTIGFFLDESNLDVEALRF